MSNIIKDLGTRALVVNKGTIVSSLKEALEECMFVYQRVDLPEKNEEDFKEKTGKAYKDAYKELDKRLKGVVHRGERFAINAYGLAVFVYKDKEKEIEGQREAYGLIRFLESQNDQYGISLKSLSSLTTFAVNNALFELDEEDREKRNGDYRNEISTRITNAKTNTERKMLINYQKDFDSGVGTPSFFETTEDFIQPYAECKIVGKNLVLWNYKTNLTLENHPKESLRSNDKTEYILSYDIEQRRLNKSSAKKYKEEIKKIKEIKKELESAKETAEINKLKGELKAAKKEAERYYVFQNERVTPLSLFDEKLNGVDKDFIYYWKIGGDTGDREAYLNLEGGKIGTISAIEEFGKIIRREVFSQCAKDFKLDFEDRVLEEKTSFVNQVSLDFNEIGFVFSNKELTKEQKANLESDLVFEEYQKDFEEFAAELNKTNSILTKDINSLKGVGVFSNILIGCKSEDEDKVHIAEGIFKNFKNKMEEKYSKSGIAYIKLKYFLNNNFNVKTRIVDKGEIENNLLNLVFLTEMGEEDYKYKKSSSETFKQKRYDENDIYKKLRLQQKFGYKYATQGMNVEKEIMSVFRGKDGRFVYFGNKIKEEDVNARTFASVIYSELKQKTLLVENAEINYDKDFEIYYGLKNNKKYLKGVYSASDRSFKISSEINGSFEDANDIVVFRKGDILFKMNGKRVLIRKEEDAKIKLTSEDIAAHLEKMIGLAEELNNKNKKTKNYNLSKSDKSVSPEIIGKANDQARAAIVKIYQMGNINNPEKSNYIDSKIGEKGYPNKRLKDPKGLTKLMSTQTNEGATKTNSGKMSLKYSGLRNGKVYYFVPPQTETQKAEVISHLPKLNQLYFLDGYDEELRDFVFNSIAVIPEIKMKGGKFKNHIKIRIESVFSKIFREKYDIISRVEDKKSRQLV